MFELIKLMGGKIVLVVDYFKHFSAAAPRRLLHVTLNITAATNLIFLSPLATANAALKHGQVQNHN